MLDLCRNRDCSVHLHSNLNCHYSLKARIGKPRGSMNKKTIERLRRFNEAAEQETQPQHALRTPPSIAGSHAQTPRPSTAVIPPLPSCGDDSILDVDSTSRATRDPACPHSSTDIDSESTPIQDFIFPNEDLEPMDTWFLDMAERCFEEVRFQDSRKTSS